MALSDDGETIVAVGENGLLWTSVDGGRTLENPGAVTARDLNGVALSADGDIAFAVGDKETILIWTKQDNMWTSVSGSDDSRIDFEAVALREYGNETTVVAVGEDGAIRRFYAKNASDKKPDNKRNWIDMDDNKRRAPDFDAVALSGDGKIAIAVGRRGAIRFSTDGGGTWKDAASKVGNHFPAVKIIGDGNRVIAVVAGDDGNIVISEDKGETWTFRDSRTASDLNAIASAGNAAVVVGENATIFRLSPPAFDVVRFPPREELAEAHARYRDNKRKSESDGGQPEGRSLINWESPYFLYLALVRVGIVMILLLPAQYLTNLARYCLQLAAFYRARRDAIKLAEIQQENLRPENIDQCEQMMHALTPYGVDLARGSSRGFIEMAMQMAQSLIGYRKGVSKTPSAGNGKES